MKLPNWGIWSALALAAVVGLAACNQDGAATDKAQASEAAAKTSSFEAKDATKAAARKSLEGRWALVISQSVSQRGFFDFYTMLFDVAKTDGKSDRYSVELLGNSELFPYDVSLKSHRVDGKSVQLVLDVDGSEVEFEGDLRDGVVWGNIDFGGPMPGPARLVATEEKTAKSFDEPKVPEGVEHLQQAAQSDDQFAGLRAFATKHPTSPMAPLVIQQVAGSLAEKDLDAQAVAKFVKDAESVAGTWGPKMKRAVKLNVAMNLAASQHLPELALKYLEDVEQQLGPERKERLSSLLSSVRDQARVAQARKLFADDQTEEALKLAKELHNRNPFDPAVNWMLASHYREQDQIDEAIPLLSRIAVLPLMEMAVVQDPRFQSTETEYPRQMLAKLWKEKHGDTEELDDYLDTVYREGIAQLTERAREQVPAAAPTGNRVVLTELFTGAPCPPCVSADLATDALQQTYERSNVVVLRYHEPTAGLDPLANMQTLQRMEFYSPQGTPAVYVNGQPVAGVGGFLNEVAGAYREIRQTVDPMLAGQTPIDLVLDANAKDGQLKVSALASGLTNDLQDLRLVVALAEESVTMAAPNGIRNHDMVVRSMFGHPQGVEAKDGRLSFETTLKLDELKEQLMAELAALEEQIGGAVPEKPMEMKDLRLVAFVQNAETKEVLQTATVPVEGEVTYTVDTAPPVPKTSPANVEDAPASEKPKDAAAIGPDLFFPESPADDQPSESVGQPE